MSLISLSSCVDSNTASPDSNQAKSSEQVQTTLNSTVNIISSSNLLSSSLQVTPDSQLLSSSEQMSSSSIAAISSPITFAPGEVATLNFQSDEHTVAGQATIQINEALKIEIQFHSNFVIDGGPDVFIFLSENDYKDVKTGAPGGDFFKIEKQIAVQNQSTEGEMLYILEGLSVEQFQKYKSLHFYCEMFGFIHWGGAPIELK